MLCPSRAFCTLFLLLQAGHVTHASDIQNLPEPNRLWFLEPYMPFLGPAASTSMELVSLEIKTPTQKTVGLKIPRAYISTVSASGQIEQTFINLAVYLPDYLPNVLAKKAGHRIRGRIINGIELRSEEEIGIGIRPARAGLDRDIIKSIKSSHISGGSFKDDFDVFYSMRRQTPTSEPIPDKHSGYFIPSQQDRVSIRLNALPATGELSGLSMRFNLSDDLIVEVSFAPKYLGQYQDHG